MTLLDDRPSIGHGADALAGEAAPNRPATRNSDEAHKMASHPPARVVKWTLVAAVVITTMIAAASFVLSFAALWDLATMAGLPRHLSWLWPVIVDGTILQATISVIAVAAYDSERSARRFFWAVLAVSALVSISSNALHAFIAGSASLHPALAAAIATVAPISLLASTDGISRLWRLSSASRVPAAATFDDTSEVDEALEPDYAGDAREPHVGEWPDWFELATTMRAKKLTSRPRDQVAEILRQKFEQDQSNRDIGKYFGGMHHSTVGRVVDAAKELVQR